MTPMIQRPNPRHTHSLRFLSILATALFVLGCASATKLAQKSQDQLAQGEVRKSYETALKAVKKEPNLEPARVALSDAGSALLAQDLERLRALVQVDTVGAAEVAIEMERIRRETAYYGVALQVDSLALADQDAARAGAARIYVQLGDEERTRGDDKSAYAYFELADRFQPGNRAIQDRLDKSYAAALDRVLVLPIRSDLRAWMDKDALTQELNGEMKKLEEELVFTQFVFPEVVWAGVPTGFAAPVSREDALRLGREAGATRVLWVRLFGDRIDSHVERYSGQLYIEPEDSDDDLGLGWAVAPIDIEVSEMWATVAIDCNVYEVESGFPVSNQRSDHQAGMRTLLSLTEFEYEGDDYHLCTPDMEENDDDLCDDLEDDWEELFGDVSVEGLVEAAEDFGNSGRTRQCGIYDAGGARRILYYGRPPRESDLIGYAVSNAWGGVADVLRNADQF